MDYITATKEMSILIKYVLIETQNKKISRKKLRNLFKKKFPITAQSIIVENRTGSVSVKLLTKVFRELEEQKVIKRHKYHNSINEGYIIVINVKKLINLCCQ